MFAPTRTARARQNLRSADLLGGLDQYCNIKGMGYLNCLGQTNCRVRLYKAASRPAACGLLYVAVSKLGILAVLCARKSSSIAASGERNNLWWFAVRWVIISRLSRRMMKLGPVDWTGHHHHETPRNANIIHLGRVD